MENFSNLSETAAFKSVLTKLNDIGTRVSNVKADADSTLLGSTTIQEKLQAVVSKDDPSQSEYQLKELVDLVENDLDFTVDQSNVPQHIDPIFKPEFDLKRHILDVMSSTTSSDKLVLINKITQYSIKHITSYIEFLKIYDRLTTRFYQTYVLDL